MPKPAPKRGREPAPSSSPTRAGGRGDRAPGGGRRAVLHLAAAALLAGGAVWGVREARDVVARASADAAAGPPGVVFAHRPGWMTDRVAAQLAESFRPARPASVFDREALVDVHRRLAASPWVAKVRQVRRAFGEPPAEGAAIAAPPATRPAAAGDTIVVDCDFRTPLALVDDNDGHYWFVDDQGVKLPEWFAPGELRQLVYAPDGRVNLRAIRGVRNPAPPRPGQRWPGDDLAAGLDLARQLAGQPFADEVVRIDVTNYAGRAEPREAHLVLQTKHGTEVRWGRPPRAADAFVEVKPERKLWAMRQIFAQYGRVDAGKPWIDLRIDTVTYPSQTAPPPEGGGHANGTR